MELTNFVDIHKTLTLPFSCICVVIGGLSENVLGEYVN